MKLKSSYLHKYQHLIEKHVSLSMTDTDGKITYVSDAFCSMTHYSRQELIGKKHSILRHPETHPRVYEELWETITQGKSWHGRIKNLNKKRESYCVDAFIEPLFEANTIVGYLAIRQNITQESHYEKLSKTDLLTGLHNRSSTEEIILHSIKTARATNELFSIIMFDIDDFKVVNDTHGHLLGDFVLKEFAYIAQKTVRTSDFVGRWGGEEFLVVLPQTDLAQAQELASRLRLAFEGHTFKDIGFKTASFGTAVFEQNDTLYTLVEKADKALYRSKTQGKNRVS